MKEIIDIFKTITKIPHCSFHAEKLKEYIVDEAKKYGCEVQTDKYSNILVSKGKPNICLQAHYDMVCIADAPDIEIVEDEGFLKAKNSSLGADNGIGVAMMLYFLQKYENIEALFTADEEVGLIGAVNLELRIKSKNLLNLDSEEEGHIFVGCAGGVEIFGTKEIEYEKLKSGYDFYQIKTRGFQGGHSGVDIDKNIPNAIKELVFYLNDLKDVKIIKIEGGEAVNSIAKNACAIIAVKDEELKESENIAVKKIKNNFDKYIRFSDETIKMLCQFAHGVRSFDKKFDIPKTSINLAKIEQKEDVLNLSFFARSMDNNSLERIKKETFCFLQSFSFTPRSEHQFPAWNPSINEFSKKVKKIAEKYFENVDFKAIHAGLECGIIQDKFKGLNTLSLGPNIYFPHSNKEKCEIASVKKSAKLVEEILKEMQ